MIAEVMEKAIAAYRINWRDLFLGSTNKEFFKGLKPTAIGWKVTDLEEFDKLYADLRTQCDQIHLGWINERWLATMHLKETKLEWGIEVIKLMQRRPDSTDKTGLDHVDFQVSSLAVTKTVLKSETNLKWTHETNNPHCEWFSVWFGSTEAKLREGTVLDVCISELKEANQHILDP